MGPCKKGGLRVVNIDLKLKAMHVIHVKHLVHHNNFVKWHAFARYWLGLSLRDVKPELASNSVPHSEVLPLFYAKTLVSFRKWAQLCSVDSLAHQSLKSVYWKLVETHLEKLTIEVSTC